MKYEISLCLAGIRPQFWNRAYQTALTSCTRYPFELVIVSPFDLPEELKNVSNVKIVKEYSCPVRASQVGTIHCEGRLLTFPCDDGEFLPDALNQSIDLYNARCGEKDGIVMRYREGPGMNASSFPAEYWNANYHIRGLLIGGDWKIAPQPMMSLEYYRKIGGVDCSLFECMAYATHDLCYRMQRDGGQFYLSPLEIQNCDNHGEHGETHSAIYYGQTQHDHPIFHSLYTNTNVLNRINVNFDAWKQIPEKWHRRNW